MIPIFFIKIFSVVLCGTPPTVENAHLIGRRRSHYDIHSVVRYQCSEGFYQRHIPTTRCRADGSWERPRIICTKCESPVYILNLACHLKCRCGEHKSISACTTRWSRCSTTAEDHVGFHSCQPRTEIWGCSGRLLMKNVAWSDESEFLLRLQMVGSEFGINSRNPWTQPALCQ